MSAGPFVYIEINHVPPQDFGYYFALNIVFLFVMTIINSRFVRRVGALNMFRAGLWIQFAMAVWMVFSALMGIGFWALVVGVAAFVGCVSMVSSNAMAVILDEFPHMAGTASSLAGTFRFGIGAIVGALLSLATFTSAWPMIWSIALCAACSILFYLYASRPKNGDGRAVPQWRRRMRRRRWGTLSATRWQSQTAFIVDVYQLPIHHFPSLCLFYVKSIYVKSHIIVVKKVELDRRNGYI